MGKNYEKLGDEIITRLGGKQNITKLFHCATRLRFQLCLRQTWKESRSCRMSWA
jgi:PTS system beta-glucosides-specific IIC component